MGEPGLPPLASAFANAVARLTDKPLHQLPFSLGCPELLQVRYEWS
jgi:isoquinoline 1-oxidoreductase beta subunit